MTEREELLEDVITQAKLTKWLLIDAKHKADEAGIGYSPEMQHAIAFYEILEVL